MKKSLAKIAGSIAVAGSLMGCANPGEYLKNLGSETMRGIGEPFQRVASEFDRGNVAAPLYATRGACNGLVRMGTAVSGEKYDRKLGEDAKICDRPFLEGATAGVVLAPVAPWSYLEGAVIGGSFWEIINYLNPTRKK
jgi:hypothetical protein